MRNLLDVFQIGPFRRIRSAAAAGRELSTESRNLGTSRSFPTQLCPLNSRRPGFSESPSRLPRVLAGLIVAASGTLSARGAGASGRNAVDRCLVTLRRNLRFMYDLCRHHFVSQSVRDRRSRKNADSRRKQEACTASAPARRVPTSGGAKQEAYTTSAPARQRGPASVRREVRDREGGRETRFLELHHELAHALDGGGGTARRSDDALPSP